MIKLLVVDDESATRKGIIKHVNWRRMGVGLVEEARDGVEGLEMALRLKPDIVISDIRMPGMNGIELSTHIREQIPECGIIFLSGYSDKEYLKAAIHLGAISYIEKPINIDELQGVIKKAVDDCHENEKKRQAEEKIVTVLSDSLPFIRQDAVFKLIAGKMVPEEVMADLMPADVPSKADISYTVSNLIPAYAAGQTNESKQSCCQEVVRYLAEQRGVFRHMAAVRNLTDIVVISSHRSCIIEAGISAVYQALKAHILEKDILCTGLSWVVGRTTKEMSGIKDSYETSVFVLEKLFYLGYNDIVFHDDRPVSLYVIDFRILTAFSELLLKQNKDEIIEYVEQLYQNIRVCIGTPADEVKDLFFQLYFSLFMEGERRGLQLKESHRQGGKYLWTLISRFLTLRELKDYLVSQICRVLDGIEDLATNSRAIQSVLSYIQEQYSNTGLSVKILADHVYLTPTYLSSLFKKETGSTISEYLTEVRIQKAIVLLKESHDKLYEIAAKAGYSDANYFSKSFKKQMGLVPSEYRRRYNA